MRQVYCSTRPPVTEVILAFGEDRRLDVCILQVVVECYILQSFRKYND